MHVVNHHADEVAGVPSYRERPATCPGPVDLAVVAVPADEVEEVVADCAAKGVRGLVVMSTGFAETGAEGVRAAAPAGRAGPGERHAGARARLVRRHQHRPGRVAERLPVAARARRAAGSGFFSQSGALGVALLDNAVRRGLGLSTFVSAGNRVDVSGNDLMQFWEEDERTDAVMLYLESIGNPRKFSRIARRLARQKPVVVVKSGRFRGDAPAGHLVRESRAPAAAVDALFRRAGRDPGRLDPPDVRRRRAGRDPAAAGRAAGRGARQLRRARAARRGRLRGGRARGREHPRPRAGRRRRPSSPPPWRRSSPTTASTRWSPCSSRRCGPATPRWPRCSPTASRRPRKTVVSTFLGMPGVPEALRAPGGGQRVGAVVRRRPRTPCARSPRSPPTPPGAPPRPATPCRPPAWTSGPPGPWSAELLAGRAATRSTLDARASCSALLRCYGIDLWDVLPGGDRRARRVAAADRLGYPVALKATAPHLRHRRDLGGVRLDIDDAEEMRGAFEAMAARLGRVRPARSSCRRWRPPGSPPGWPRSRTRCSARSCPSGSAAWPPTCSATGRTASRRSPTPTSSGLVRGVRAAPLLLGHGGQHPGGRGRARGPAGPAGPAGRRRARGGRARAQPGGRRARPGPRCSPPPAGWPGPAARAERGARALGA